MSKRRPYITRSASFSGEKLATASSLAQMAVAADMSEYSTQKATYRSRQKISLKGNHANTPYTLLPDHAADREMIYLDKFVNELDRSTMPV